MSMDKIKESKGGYCLVFKEHVHRNHCGEIANELEVEFDLDTLLYVFVNITKKLWLQRKKLWCNKYKHGF